jgi:hypothetical protein
MRNRNEHTWLGGLCQCPGPQSWGTLQTPCAGNQPFRQYSADIKGVPSGWDPVDTCYCTLGPPGTAVASRTPDLCTQHRVLGILLSVTGHWDVPDPTCCSPGFTACGDVCANLNTDPQHCGKCGVVCPPPPSNGVGSCYNGQCGISCDSGYLPCGGLCCQAPPGNATFHCPGCYWTCNPGFTFCGGHGGAIGCFDLQWDHQHCGTCDNACGYYENCVNGQCQSQQPCPLGQIKCGNNCVTPTCSGLCPSSSVQLYLAEEANSKCFLGFYTANTSDEAMKCAERKFGVTVKVGSAKSGGNFPYAVTCPGYPCEPVTNVIALSEQDGLTCVQSQHVNCTVERGTC